MIKIPFEDRDKKEVSAVLRNESESLTAGPSERRGNALIFDFDEEKYDSISFLPDGLSESARLYPGELSIGVSYRMNDRTKTRLSYLWSEGNEVCGRVENHLLTDEKNLSYRADKSKKISVFIPSHYDGSEKYDLIYFFDAQNLFSNSGAYTDRGDPYGSWQLDLLLQELYLQRGKKIIAVGIDNADEYRSQELFMDHASFGQLSPLATAIPEDDFSKGYLDRLSAFMTETLHPFIEKSYSVKSDKIGIGGSSMGGIAAFYCALKEIGFYKYVLSYSPAYALYETEAYDAFFERLSFREKEDILPKIHIYCGGGDMLEEMLLPAAKNMKELLVMRGYPADKIYETYDGTKPHNEESWRLILPRSFSILL